MTKLLLEWLNATSKEQFVSALANIFEHSPWIAEKASAGRPYRTLAGLCEALMAAATAVPPEQMLELIRSHPDLANNAQRAAGLTADSVSEQDGAGLDRLSDVEFTAFSELNDSYKAKFGFPFIACVKQHTKDSILNMFRLRLKHDPDQELAAAFAEIRKIATLRLAQLVEGPDTLPVFGSLSTHVLDTSNGVPAKGVAIELVELSELGDDRTIVKTVTNGDGRTDLPLMQGRPLPVGVYELRFDVRAYFDERGMQLSEPAFLDIIPIRFGISDPVGHLHVPLLVTPWSYATYRGS